MNKNTYKLLFEKEEEEAKKIDGYRYDMLYGTGHTDRDIDKIKEDAQFIFNFKEDYFVYKEINDDIQYITSREYKEQIPERIKKMENYNIVVRVTQNSEKSFTIETIDGVISFFTIDSLVTDRIKILAKNSDEEGIRKYFSDIAYLDKRIQRCHTLGVFATHILREFLDLKNELVTGYTCFATEKSKYLHTWNEFELDGRQYVLDSTMNVIMNKEGYYLLRHIEQIVDRIESDDVISDFEKYGDLIMKLGIKPYVTARELIIKDLEKSANNMEGR